MANKRSLFCKDLRMIFILFFQRTIKEEDYVVVLFLSNCDKNDKCEETLTDLEEIDDQLEEIGILFFYTDDETYAAKLKVLKVSVCPIGSFIFWIL